MPVQKGQIYLIDSFYLGFINVPSAEIGIEIEEVDHANDFISLRLVPFHQKSSERTFLTIAHWFETQYPLLSDRKTLLKKANFFEMLVSNKAARLADTFRSLP